MAGIIFVLVRTAVPEIYGGERSTIAAATGLAKRGYQPFFLVTARDDLVAELESQGFPFEVVEVADPFEGLRTTTWSGRFRKLRDIMRINRATFRRVRRGNAIVHANAVPGFYSAWLGARLSGARIIYQVRGASRNSRTRWFEEMAVLLADRTVTVSHALRDQLVHTGHRWLSPLLASRVGTVHTGFDFSEVDRIARSMSVADARSVTGRRGDQTNLLIVGGLQPIKGQLRFLERVLPNLVRQCPRLHVTFIGGAKDPGYAAACRAAVGQAGLPSYVTFAGYLPPADVFKWYRGSDLTVIPSEREGLPRVAIESQAFGVPVVGTTAVGMSETVLDGVTGYLVPNDRIEEMVAPLARLIEDANLRHSFGEAGASEMRRRFSFERNVVALSEVYAGLLDRT